MGEIQEEIQCASDKTNSTLQARFEETEAAANSIEMNLIFDNVLQRNPVKDMP